jgi:anti-sigma factor RsiW
VVDAAKSSASAAAAVVGVPSAVLVHMRDNATSMTGNLTMLLLSWSMRVAGWVVGWIAGWIAGWVPRFVKGPGYQEVVNHV